MLCGNKNPKTNPEDIPVNSEKELVRNELLLDR